MTYGTPLVNVPFNPLYGRNRAVLRSIPLWGRERISVHPSYLTGRPIVNASGIPLWGREILIADFWDTLPLSLLGIRLWLAPESLLGYIEDDPISIWPDLSGNGSNATGTGTARPLYKAGVFGGYPAARFDDSNDVLAVNGIAGLFSITDGPMTIYIAMRKSSNVDEHSIIGGSNSGNTAPLRVARTRSGGAYEWLNRDNGNNAASPSGGTAGIDPQIATYVFHGTTASAFKNNVAQFTEQASDVGVLTINQAAIGALQARGATPATNFFGGDIAEIILYDVAHNASQRTAVNRYLSLKYGIAV